MLTFLGRVTMSCNGYKTKQEVKNDLLSIYAPLFDERCNYQPLIVYLTIWKLNY